MKLFGRRAPGRGATRVFFVTDLHGSSTTFRKLLNAARVYKVDYLVCGGDVVGKSLYPIADHGDGRYVCTVHGREEWFEGEEGLARAKRLVEEAGAYHVTLSPDEVALYKADSERLNTLFLERVKDRLREWVTLADERLAQTGAMLYVTGGNDDSDEMLAALHEVESSNVVLCEGRCVDVGGYPMASLGWSNETPWKTPRETTEERLAELIEQAVTDLDDFERAIFNFHVPPKDSALDTCPALDTSTSPPKPIVRGSEQIMFGAGSSAVAAAIERYQPLLSLHGHIHESPGVVALGRTTAINPGSEYQHGALNGAIVTLEGGAVTGYQLTRG
jgi:Icc-related predicted phosphoesterase